MDHIKPMWKHGYLDVSNSDQKAFGLLDGNTYTSTHQLSIRVRFGCNKTVFSLVYRLVIPVCILGLKLAGIKLG